MDNRGSLADGYDRSAPAYDILAGIYLKSLWGMLPRVRVQPFPCVLDVGCGTGLALLEVARELSPCRSLVGVDISPGMLDIARQKAESVGIAANFVNADIASLELPPSSFDLILCNGVLHWLDDRPAIMKKLHGLLRPGGQLLLSCVAEPGFTEWNELVASVYATLPGGGKPWFPRLPSPRELLDDARGASLWIEHLNYEVEPFMVRDPVWFVRTMSIIAPNWLSAAPDGQRDALARAVTQAILAHAPMGFLCTKAGVAVIARKIPAMPG
jgi:ubiquinone/menaquinone biosynthesis C-methylase UbiE